MVNLATDTAPHVSVKRAELDAIIDSSIAAALQKNLSPRLAPATGAEMAQEKAPDHSVLRAIHDWSLKPDTSAPRLGEIIEVRQDGTVEIVTEQVMRERVQKAEMEQVGFALAPFVNQLDNAFGFNIPWGSIAFGILPGAVVSEVVDGVTPPRNVDGSLNFVNLLTKGVIAGVGVQALPPVIGRRASQFFAAGLGLFILADLLPINQWVANIVGLFGGNRQMALQQQRLGRRMNRLTSGSWHDGTWPGATFDTRQGGQTSFIDPTFGDEALETLRGLAARA